MPIQVTKPAQPAKQHSPLLGWIIILTFLGVSVFFLSRLTLSEKDASTSKELVTGMVIQKDRASGGGVKLVIERPDNNQSIVLLRV